MLCRSLGSIVGLILLVVSSYSLLVAAEDGRCTGWAEMGECENNPGYMMQNCAQACKNLGAAQAALAEEFQGVEFFDLSANDIDGNLIAFGKFRGKVTIITNVASYCGYTESHYKGLVELYSELQNEPVEILAFPCNQFGKQEPGSDPEIKQFAKKKGVEFTMMSKTQVNGSEASKVFKFLKYNGNVSSIGWNFATYFVVGPDGSVTAHSEVEPMDLKDDILKLLKKDEL